MIEDEPKLSTVKTILAAVVLCVIFTIPICMAYQIWIDGALQ